MSTRNIGIAFVFSSVALVALAGCSGGDMSGAGAGGPDAEVMQSDINSYGATLEEYKSAQAQYEMPVGVSYPTDPFHAGEQYQKQYGVGEAIHRWNCAWGEEWLAQRGVDESRATEAFEKYSSITDTDFYKQFYDPLTVQGPFEEALQAAELGDPSQVQRDISLNCSRA